MSVVETERLRLREITGEDAAFILELVNEPAFIANIRDSGVRDLHQARRYIEEGPRVSYAAHGFGLWLAELKAGAEPVGICGLLRRAALPDVDLGYAVLERFRGQGYAREAVAAVLGYAQGTLGLKRIVAVTTRDNQASVRVLAAAGFQPEGTIAFGERESLLFAWPAA